MRNHRVASGGVVRRTDDGKRSDEVEQGKEEAQAGEACCHCPGRQGPCAEEVVSEARGRGTAGRRPSGPRAAPAADPCRSCQSRCAFAHRPVAASNPSVCSIEGDDPGSSYARSWKPIPKFAAPLTSRSCSPSRTAPRAPDEHCRAVRRGMPPLRGSVPRGPAQHGGHLPAALAARAGPPRRQAGED